MTLCAEKVSHLIRYERALFNVFAYIRQAFFSFGKKTGLEKTQNRQIPVAFFCSGPRTELHNMLHFECFCHMYRYIVFRVLLL